MLAASLATLAAVPTLVLAGGREAAAGSLAELGVAETRPPAPRAEPAPQNRPAAAVGTHSARLADQPRRVTRRPVALRIPALGVDAAVRPVGVRRGLLEVPPNPQVAGWYRHGAAPGEPGSTVLVGHVDLDGRRGAFFRLRELEPGALVTVRLDRGAPRTYRVVARRTYPKDSLPAKLVFARGGSSYLTLVTCGGAYDRAAREYADNVVVFARPLRAGPARTRLPGSTSPTS